VSEAVLAALIAGGFATLTAIVNVLGDRLRKQVEPEPEHHLTEAELLRIGIRRHVVQCPRPNDLMDLL
jgi:hypothetical protein